ncbi:MAG: hypothetical protein H6R15_498 [Proteobacteria bacterium]|nr:hypothetical protein [Pseudomonadota bacterium]
MLTWGFILIAMVLSAAAGTVMLGRRRWQRETAARRTMMRAACFPSSVATYDRREIEALPPPVKRYFEAALQDGQAMVASVRFAQQGQFRQDEKKDTWQPFRATQLATMHPPGFDWDARIRMAPGLDVWVRDAYALGVGSLRASLLGVLTVADLHDTAASARGELMRYLAEAAWYPTALLPSQGVLWEGIDEASARATLGDGTTTVTLEFRFGTDGLIASVWAESRPRSETEAAPWLCRISCYEQRGGMRVPALGEVEWELPSGPAPYFRGRMTDIDYEFATR